MTPLEVSIEIPSLQEKLVVFFIKSYTFRIEMKAKLKVRVEMGHKGHFSSITSPIIKIFRPHSAKGLWNMGLNTSIDEKVITTWDGFFHFEQVYEKIFFLYGSKIVSLSFFLLALNLLNRMLVIIMNIWVLTTWQALLWTQYMDSFIYYSNYPFGQINVDINIIPNLHLSGRLRHRRVKITFSMPHAF